MLLSFLTRFETVHQALTPQEKEGVYRLRYDVYAKELNKGFLDGIDHQNGWIRDEEDERPDSVIFYTGLPEAMTGTMRLDVYKPGEMSEKFKERFSLKLLPQLAQRSVSEFSRLIISKKHRGLLILPALSREAYRHILSLENLRYAFLYCAPGLVNAYRKLGARPYAGDLIFNQDGVRVPMIIVFSDVDYMCKVGSPVIDLAKKKFKTTVEADLEPIRHAIDDIANYKLGDEEVWNDVQDSIASRGGSSVSFLERLPTEVVKWLSKRGFVIDVPEGRKMVRETLIEEEMFIILEGDFEVVKEGKRIAVLSKGEIFGEMAFFLEAKQRTASVFSLTGGKLLVIRRKLLNELMKENPALANEILINLCKTLSERLRVK